MMMRTVFLAATLALWAGGCAIAANVEMHDDEAISQTPVSTQDLLPPTQVSLPLTGYFTYFADAAIFRECFTQQRVPVVMEQDYLAMEQAYLALRTEDIQPIFAVVEGQVAWRPAMEGPDRPQLVVERFIQMDPSAACPTFSSPAPLADTYWRPVKLGADLIGDLEARNEPYAVLFGEDGLERVAATLGCNRMMGSVSHPQDGQLQFGPVASTLMACPEPVARLERAFAAALEATRGYQYQDERLQFLDDTGEILVEWVAIYHPESRSAAD